MNWEQWKETVVALMRRCYDICLKELEKKETSNFNPDVPKEIRNGHFWNRSRRYSCL